MFDNLLRLFGRSDAANTATSSATQPGVIGDGLASIGAELVDTDDGSLSIGDAPAIYDLAAGKAMIDIVVEPNTPSRLNWDRRWDRPAPTMSSTPRQEMEWFSADRHARQLLGTLQGWGFGGREIASAILTELYGEMCRRLGWKPGPWNPVAAQFRRVTGNRKIYRWFKLESGKPHRLRVYPIPAAAQPEQWSTSVTEFRDLRGAA
jgi:hypothetical protein